jgi:hypothetical protein
LHSMGLYQAVYRIMKRKPLSSAQLNSLAYGGGITTVTSS